MIAIDTTILVYAFRADSPRHEVARQAVESVVMAGRRVGIPWPCVHEFMSVASNPRMPNPASVAACLDAARALDDSGRVSFLHETDGHLELLAGLVETGMVRGPRIHDARIAAICLGHGVDELWTADRDFSAFPALRTHNPLVAS